MTSSKALVSFGIIGSVCAVSTFVIIRKTWSKNTSPKKHPSLKRNGVELSFLQHLLFEGVSKGVDQVVGTAELSSTTPSQVQLENAIARARQRDPTLNFAFVEDQGTYLLLKCPGVSGTLEIIQDGDWKEVAQQALNEIQFPKPTHGNPVVPTWKVMLVTPKTASSSSALIFVLNHALFDGTV